MKKKLFGAIALLALMAAPALAEAATRGFATANVNMRSGPSTAYPAVVVIPDGAPLTIHGCLSDTPWCDVSFSYGRGWVAGRYIQALYRQNRVYVEPRYYRDLGVPVITFEVGRYWDRYYRDRDFYRERDRWRRPPPAGGYWNAPPPWADRDRPRPPREEWRDRRGPGPNDGRWEERYGNWNQGDRTVVTASSSGWSETGSVSVTVTAIAPVGSATGTEMASVIATGMMASANVAGRSSNWSRPIRAAECGAAPEIVTAKTVKTKSPASRRAFFMRGLFS